MIRSEINVLIACEESQTICLAFRLQGFNAFSCDIQPTTNVYPEWHIHEDALNVLCDNPKFETQDHKLYCLDTWHLMIAHPPCTYLSNAGAVHLFPNGRLDQERYQKGLEAKRFFYRFLNAPIPYICVENPIPSKIFELPKPTTKVQPYEFGEPFRKTTLLWLKNLPPLMPVLYVPRVQNYVYCARTSKTRSKSFHGIAKAMAIQWGNFVLNDLDQK